MPRPIVAIVQARMGSTRLPGKVMQPIVGKPMLTHVLDRLERVGNLDRVVVATSRHEREAPIVELVEARPRTDLFQGSEADVLARYRDAGRAFGARTVVRITADCPLIDPGVVGDCVAEFQSRAGEVDYLSNALERTFPRGLDTEIIGFEALETAFQEARAEADREHVTPFIWRQPERFRLVNFAAQDDHSDLRWTVDTSDDLRLVRMIYEALYPVRPDFDHHDVLALLSRHPTWSQLNRHVEQKGYGQ